MQLATAVGMQLSLFWHTFQPRKRTCRASDETNILGLGWPRVMMALDIACNPIMTTHLIKHHADATVEQLPPTEYDLLQAAYVEYAGVFYVGVLTNVTEISGYGCDQLYSTPNGPPRPNRLSCCALFVQRFWATHAAKLQKRDCST